MRERVAIARHGRTRELGEIEAHALGLLNALLDPARGAERTQDRLQPDGALAGAEDIAALVAAPPLGFQIVERGAHDGERCAQLVRELAAERAQIARVLVEAGKQPLESPRERPDLIGAPRLRHLQADPAVIADG